MKDVDEAKVFAFIHSLQGISPSEKEKCFAIFYEGLLDAFFDVHGYNEQKQLAWHMIDEKCLMAETKMFVRWAGAHRFDEAESKEGICVLCHGKTMCAPILFPSDKTGRADRLFFCRDCYGDVFYDNDYGDNDLHQSKRRNMLNVIFPNGIDDGFSLD